MLFIPLPFVVAILLLVLFAVVAKGSDQASVKEAPRNLPFLALILMSAFQSFLGGLRWGYGIGEIIYVAPIGAAIVPPLAYLGACKLTRKPSASSWRRLGLHALPAVVITLLVIVWRGAIDVALPLIFIGYAVAILLLMRSGTDSLRTTSFESAPRVFRALVFTAFALLLSAALDVFVALDFAWTEGRHAVLMIVAGNLGALIILSIAGAVASRGRSFPEVAEPPSQPDTAEDKDTMTAIRALLEAKRVYRDPDLNLDRLARKAGIPARQISTAINRTTGKNVSQYVNEFRVAEACGLLEETKRPVTDIMFEVGFQTKSNFNREFRRVTEMTPLEWRERKENPA
ncbi:AraC family transcriptional regulator [Rhizobium sp. AC27/96]|uniref:helix-turn-helix domain-containing protein n=1 Tax=Rhizobium TaxID=379 RepID=UPI0008294160|nr:MULTISPECIES: AraC family transcriptional regulator [Rhizobium]NTF44497.1 helix-turn-helix transcriptional regulator [Rhizobium rhizogenes]OCI93855.1 AraC family transcriptional regulator [Rhizobium sp. AC27/96]